MIRGFSRARLAVLGFLTAMLLPAVGQAQLAYDTSTTAAATVSAAAPTVTFTHTSTTSENRLMIVGISANITANTGLSVSAVSYDNVPLTLDAAGTREALVRLETWSSRAVQPSSGANTVSVTFTGFTGAATAKVVIGASTFIDADYTASALATTTNNGSSTTPTQAVTSAAGRLVVDFVAARSANPTPSVTVGAGQTADYSANSGAATTNDTLGFSSRETGAASVTMSWTLGSSQRWVNDGYSLVRAATDVGVTQTVDPVAAGGTTTFTFVITDHTQTGSNGVSFADTLPAGFTATSVATTRGTCTIGGGGTTISCTIGTLASDATGTVTVIATAPAAGTYSNTGTITTGTFDSNAANNSSTVSVVVGSSIPNPTCNPAAGNGGAGGTLSGIVNTYFPGSASITAGATSVTVGAASGATTPIAIGDLLMIVQMQDAGIDSNNDERYGDGTGTAAGTTGVGSGSNALNSAGRYEYVVATNAVTVAGGTINFTGAGTASGTVFAYNNAAATGTQGQRRFQVIRVPQYTTATLSSGLTALAWNGAVGGVLTIDAAGVLTLGGTVSVNAMGFRGGAGRQVTGGTGASTDYRVVSGNANGGTKGEGIAGTPQYLYNPATGAIDASAAQGYPNGDADRGAPGNAGGGGTDGNPAANDQNSGGGGGGNGGAGGIGGNSWSSNLRSGGFGGAAFQVALARLALGGGGGGGSRNNDDGNDSASSGAKGGGMVIFRAGSLTGTGTITADGSAAYNDTLNDGGGGGGAGGTIVVLTRTGGTPGLTTSAVGGRGGDAWRTQAFTGYPDSRHGPGGGGGGGIIIISGSTGATVTGGVSGITTTASDQYGATDGSPGLVFTNVALSQMSGTKPGALCAADVQMNLSASPATVTAGNNITYTNSVTNNGPLTAAGVQFSFAIPAGTTYASITVPAGWTCSGMPAIGGTGTITCTATSTLASGATTSSVFIVVATDPALADGSNVNASATCSTTTPDSNPANNTASTVTPVIRRVDVSIVKSSAQAPDVGTGTSVTYSLLVTNNGPSRATNVVVSDPLPSGFSFSSVTPGGPTCVNSSGTITCTYASLDPTATRTISITGTITAVATQITNTATVTQTETDTNPANNTSSLKLNVVYVTAVTMLTPDAIQDSKGTVQVSWNTTFEADNLGFNVYRLGNDGSNTKINKRLIAGSALFSGNNRELTSGRGYRWSEKLPKGMTFAQYIVEDVDLHGVKTQHGPVTPRLVNTVAEAANTDTIADLGSTGGIFVSPRGLGAPKLPVLAPTKAQRSQQYDLAAQAAIKFMVTEEGWYRVKRSELAAAGFDPGTTAKGLALFVEGIEQPIIVNDGGDGSFDLADTVEFYGLGMDTPATGARAYWLVNQKGKGLRLSTDKSKGKATAPATFPYTYQRIERTVFFTALVNNGDNENFFGAIVSSAPTSQQLSTEHLDASGGNATLNVIIQGATDGAHTISLDVNGHMLNSLQLSFQQRLVTPITIPAAWLVEGTNTLTLTASNDLDVSVVEALSITYPHRLLADNDALKLTVGGATSVTVDGFTTGSVRVIDVTDPAAPVNVTPDVSASGSGFKATFVSPDGSSRTLMALGDTRVSAPAQLVASRASTWNDKKNSADLVVVTARAFTSAATPLKTRRDSEGVTTSVVDVQDLYDEFSFGERSPEAIRQFLIASRDWRKSPRYVLLLGDASYDPRNYLAAGTFDFVPTKLVGTALLKTSSDDWFADLTGNGVPQVAMGRIPSRTLDEATVMINKIVNRGRDADAAGAWSKSVLAIGDINDGYDFENAANTLQQVVPASLTKSTIIVSTTPNAHTAVTSALGAGSLLAMYFGHGSTELWHGGNITGEDVAQLANGTKLPAVIAMTCLNGYFHDLFSDSLAETLMKNPNGGAVAVWASSALTEPGPQSVMAKELYKQLFSNANPAIGDAMNKAKASTSDTDVRRSWILFGDPSMKLR